MSPRSASARPRLVERAISFVRYAGGSRLGVFLIGRVVSPVQRWVYRVSRGRISVTGRAPVLLLTTTGRKTGKPRTVPLFYVRDGDPIIVCNARPPFERTNPWTLNLRAVPLASVQIRGEEIRCRARGATDGEVAAYWPSLIDIWPAYQRFVDQGGERSVFVLEPLGNT